MYKGFDPVFDEKSETLILGSFPSVKSREVGFYYGNKRNRFWGLMRKIYGEDFGDDKASKTEFLLRNRIALWDAVISCEITGSLDSDIKNGICDFLHNISPYSHALHKKQKLVLS